MTGGHGDNSGQSLAMVFSSGGGPLHFGRLSIIAMIVCSVPQFLVG